MRIRIPNVQPDVWEPEHAIMPGAEDPVTPDTPPFPDVMTDRREIEIRGRAPEEDRCRR